MVVSLIGSGMDSNDPQDGCVRCFPRKMNWEDVVLLEWEAPSVGMPVIERSKEKNIFSCLPFC